MICKHLTFARLALVFNLFLSIEAATAQQDSLKIHNAILAAREQFDQVVDARDWAGLAALYTENGQLLPPNNGIVRGRHAIQEFWRSAFSGIGQRNLESVEIEGQDSTAFEIGMYWLIDSGRQLIDEGKYVVIWRQERGQWKLHCEIWNSNIAISRQKPKK